MASSAPISGRTVINDVAQEPWVAAGRPGERHRPGRGGAELAVLARRRRRSRLHPVEVAAERCADAGHVRRGALFRHAARAPHRLHLRALVYCVGMTATSVDELLLVARHFRVGSPEFLLLLLRHK